MMEKKVDRRTALKIAGGVIGGLVVGGVAGYLARAPVTVEKTITVPVERTVEKTVEKTVTTTVGAATVRETVTTTVTAGVPTVRIKPEWEPYIPRADRFLEKWVIDWAKIPTGKYIVPYDPIRNIDWDAVKAEWKGTKVCEACEGVDISAPETFKPAFEALTGATLEILGIPTEVYHEKLMAEFTAPTGRYDACELFVDWGASYMPYVVDLTPFAKKYGIDIDVYHPAFRMLAVSDGKLLGLPNDSDMHVFHYRANLLKKYLGTEKPPETYLEVLQYCEKMFDKAKADGVYPWCVLCGKDFWAMWYLYQIALMYGGELFKPNSWEPAINTEPWLIGLKIYKKLLEYSPPGALHFYYGDAREAWLGGKIVMFHLWQCVGRQAYDPKLSAISPLTHPEEKIRHAPMPAGTHFRPGFLWTTTVVGVPKTSRVQELGFLWAAFLTSAEAAFILGAAGTGVESGHTYVLNNPIAWRAQPSYRPEWLQLAYGWTNICIPETYDIEIAIGESVYPYLEGTEPDPKKCLDRANERVRKILEDAGYFKPGVPPPPVLSVAGWCELNNVELPYSGWEPLHFDELSVVKEWLEAHGL
jgi:multiple sugar transport system substrate-binding protein